MFYVTSTGITTVVFFDKLFFSIVTFIYVTLVSLLPQTYSVHLIIYQKKNLTNVSESFSLLNKKRNVERCRPKRFSSRINFEKKNLTESGLKI